MADVNIVAGPCTSVHEKRAQRGPRGSVQAPRSALVWGLKTNKNQEGTMEWGGWRAFQAKEITYAQKWGQGEQGKLIIIREYFTDHLLSDVFLQFF